MDCQLIQRVRMARNAEISRLRGTSLRPEHDVKGIALAFGLDYQPLSQHRHP
jgi:hypothetical protein